MFNCHLIPWSYSLAFKRMPKMILTKDGFTSGSAGNESGSSDYRGI